MPSGKPVDKELIGKMNRARTLRNEYMHDGRLPSDPKEVIGLLESTKKFVQDLRQLDQECG